MNAHLHFLHINFKVIYFYSLSQVLKTLHLSPLDRLKTNYIR